MSARRVSLKLKGSKVKYEIEVIENTELKVQNLEMTINNLQNNENTSVKLTSVYIDKLEM